MNWVDYSILGIVFLSVIVGFLRGFTREFFGLGAWALALGLTVLLGHQAVVFLQPYLAVPLVRAGVGYGGLFLLGLLAGGVITALLVSRVRQSRFSSADRTLGSGIGLIRGILLVGLAVLLGNTMGLRDRPWWQQSALVPPAKTIADGLGVLIPKSWLDPLRPDGAAQTVPVRDDVSRDATFRDAVFPDAVSLSAPAHSV